MKAFILFLGVGTALGCEYQSSAWGGGLHWAEGRGDWGSGELRGTRCLEWGRILPKEWGVFPRWRVPLGVLLGLSISWLGLGIPLCSPPANSPSFCSSVLQFLTHKSPPCSWRGVVVEPRRCKAQHEFGCFAHEKCQPKLPESPAQPRSTTSTAPALRPEAHRDALGAPSTPGALTWLHPQPAHTSGSEQSGVKAVITSLRITGAAGGFQSCEHRWSMGQHLRDRSGGSGFGHPVGHPEVVVELRDRLCGCRCELEGSAPLCTARSCMQCNAHKTKGLSRASGAAEGLRWAGMAAAVRSSA